MLQKGGHRFSIKATAQNKIRKITDGIFILLLISGNQRRGDQILKQDRYRPICPAGLSDSAAKPSVTLDAPTQPLHCSVTLPWSDCADLYVGETMRTNWPSVLIASLFTCLFAACLLSICMHAQSHTCSLLAHAATDDHLRAAKAAAAAALVFQTCNRWLVLLAVKPAGLTPAGFLHKSFITCWELLSAGAAE